MGNANEPITRAHLVPILLVIAPPMKQASVNLTISGLNTSPGVKLYTY